MATSSRYTKGKSSAGRRKRSILEVAPGSTIDIRAWSLFVREKMWLVVVLVASCLGAAVLYMQKAPVIYRAQSTVDVLPEAVNFLGADAKNPNPGAQASMEAVKTVESGLRAPMLLVRVARKAGLLDKHPEFKAAAAKHGGTLPESKVADLMAARTDVRQQRASRTIDIFVEDPSPEVAAQLSGLIVTEYIANRDEMSGDTAGSAAAKLLLERDRIQGELRDLEQRLLKFRQDNASTDLDQKDSMLRERLAELEKQVSEARTRMIQLETDIPRLARFTKLDADRLLEIESISRHPQVFEVTKQLINAESAFSELRQRYLERHPRYIAAQRQVEQLRADQERVARRAAGAISSSAESARAAFARYEDELAKAKREAVQLSEVAIPYNQLRDQVETKQQTLKKLQERIDQLQIMPSTSARNIQIQSLALIPDRSQPYKPNKAQILVLGLVAGLGFSAILLFLLKALDSSVISVDQAESQFGLPVFAPVPEAKGPQAKSQLVIADYPASREAEAFRCLRTAVSLSNLDNTQKVVLFTSACPSEGKSYCSSNFAASLAQQGLRTLIIDADLRRPALGRVFPGKEESLGISDFLSSRATFDDCWHVTGVGKLYYMPAGMRNESPAELLTGDTVSKILKEAARKFDRVVIDSAPVNAVSDTLVLATHADSVIFVIHARKTPARAVKRALQQLDAADGLPAGLVLNRLPLSGAKYFYYDEGSYTSEGVYGT
jgi:capsular exopolysaccharide synthesis family protein